MTALVVRETFPAGAPAPKLLDRVRTAVRARHYSRRTEEAYIAWIRRYILFHGKRHPVEMGAPEVTRFLSGEPCQTRRLVRRSGNGVPRCPVGNWRRP